MISFDEEILNGFGFNEKDCKIEQKNVASKELKKDIYIKYKTEQNNRKLKNKIPSQGIY